MALSPGPRAREVGRQFLLMVVENARRLAVFAHERAIDVGILHELDDGIPAGLVESVLKRVARGVTAGADIAHEPLHALVLLGLLGQRRQHDVARQLPNEVLHRIENETVLGCRGQIDVGFGGLEAYRLRPEPVLSGGQRREIVFAARIGEDGGGHGSAHGLRGYGNAAEFLAGRRGDRAAEDGIAGVCARRKAHHRSHDGDQRGEQDTVCAGHDFASGRPRPLSAPGLPERAEWVWFSGTQRSLRFVRARNDI